MNRSSRPFVILLLEIGFLLVVLHLGGSPLGAHLPASAAAIVLAAGLIAIPILLILPRWPAARPVVVACVAALMILSGATALAMSSPNPGSDIGILCLGGMLVASEFSRRRAPPA